MIVQMHMGMDPCCEVCRYPRRDGTCQNPVCGETDDARQRFAAAAERRAAEDAAREQSQALLRMSFASRK